MSSIYAASRTRSYKTAASIMYGTASSVMIHVHSTGENFSVLPFLLELTSQDLKAGDKIMRVMFNGAEESGTVIRIESSTHAFIKLDDGRSYSSDRFRLRKVNPAPIPLKVSASAPVSATKVEKIVDVESLRSKLATKTGVSVQKISLNNHAVTGTSMHSAFEQRAKALAATHEVDVLLHGSSESNVDSILRRSLSVQHSRHGSMFWLTDHLATAQGYMHGASRVVGFAVLRSKGATTPSPGIHVISDPTHLLPLFSLTVV